MVGVRWQEVFACTYKRCSIHVDDVYHAGLEIDGQEIAPVNEEEIAQEAVACRSRGIRLVAVVGIFSPLDNDGRQEYRVKQIFHQTAPEIAVICSRDVGHVGLYVKLPWNVVLAS